MIAVHLINWQPMDTMPEDRKDGRLVLLWSEGGAEPQLGFWDGDGWGSDLGYQRFPGGEWEAPVFEKEEFHRIAYWADINPPA